jgi:4-carboxymuconolactone decarboxylase
MAGSETREDLRRKGAEVLSALGHGTTPPRPRPLYLASIEGMEHYTSEALWGSVWSRPGLSLRVRVLETLSVLASLQRIPQLRTYLNSAMNAGLDAAEVREVLIQCSAFAGFPATVNALELFREILESRGISIEAPAGEGTTDEADPIEEVGLDALGARGRSLRLRLFGGADAWQPASAAPGSAGGAGLDEPGLSGESKSSLSSVRSSTGRDWTCRRARCAPYHRWLHSGYPRNSGRGSPDALALAWTPRLSARSCCTPHTTPASRRRGQRCASWRRSSEAVAAASELLPSRDSSSD